MRYLLRHHGWQARDAETLAGGTEMLRECAPDVLLLDLMLPDGDGIDLLRAIRAERLPVRVAVITGIGDPDAISSVRQLQPDAFFRKPVNVHALLQWLDDVKGD